MCVATLLRGGENDLRSMYAEGLSSVHENMLVARNPAPDALQCHFDQLPPRLNAAAVRTLP